MIRVTQAELETRRASAIKLVRSLVADKRGFEVRQVGGGGDYVVAAIPKGTGPRDISDPEQTRLPSKIEGVFLSYHERWHPVPKSSDYQLDRVYLHLHIAPRRGEDRQVLCFHFEPSAGATDASAAFKNGPHLHLGGAVPSISKSHIAICVNDENLGGTDIVGLERTLTAAIRMIELEMLPKYAHAM